MVIELNPETEKLLEKEISSGRFKSVDEIIVCGIRSRVAPPSADPVAIQETHEGETHEGDTRKEDTREDFATFLRRSPLFGSGIVIPEREIDVEPEVQL